MDGGNIRTTSSTNNGDYVDEELTRFESRHVEDDRNISFRDTLAKNGEDFALLDFGGWDEGEAPLSADDDCCSAYSESLWLTELVGDKYLDVLDTSMEVFKEQLREDLDKLSGKVMGSDDQSESCDLLSPTTKARECVAALSFLGLKI